MEALALRPPLLHVHQQAQILYTVYTLSTEVLSSISLPRWRVPWYSRRVLPLFWIIKYQYLSMQRSKNFHSPLETSTERIELNCVQYLLSCMYIYITNVSLCTTYNVSIHVFDTLLHVFLVNICTWVIFSFTFIDRNLINQLINWTYSNRSTVNPCLKIFYTIFK